MLGSLQRFWKNLRRRDYADIDPDLIFLDSKNLPDFDVHQFEGRIEKPISPRSFYFLATFIACVMVLFVFKAGTLQIANGAYYRERSESNKLKQLLIFAPRGTIYSRDGIELAWNQKASETELLHYNFPLRKYTDLPGFGTLLGFVKYPAKDKAGFYYEEEFIPKDGLELYLDEILRGKNGHEFIETTVNGEIVSQNVAEPPRYGENATLSIDSGIQSELFKQIKSLAEKVNFQGGSGVIMDIDSGELLAMTSFPEYDGEVMALGQNHELIDSYFKNPNNPFLNRVVGGLYTPGSIIKPFVALAALEEGIISPEREIVSTGRLVVPNPYNPDSPSIFKDWKAHGAVDMRRAIAVSSDVYFYQIGGGFENQKGLGVERIKKYLESFGFTKKTGFDNTNELEGVIPNPEWKAKNFDGEIWRVGDTYNTAIGQYGMQITPLQAVVGVAALANDGYLQVPSILFTSTTTKSAGNKVKGLLENFKIVKEGMRQAVLEGTAAGLNVPYVAVAGKTGTAELGARKQFVNSWVIGFFPFDKPKYAFAVVMERGPVKNLTGATFVMRQTLDWMNVNTPEYFEME